MNADQTLRGESHDLVLHSGLSGVTGRCTCGAWSGGGRRELPSRVAHQWDAEHLTTLPLEQIDAHGSAVEYRPGIQSPSCGPHCRYPELCLQPEHQPAEPETASERPDAGRETALSLNGLIVRLVEQREKHGDAPVRVFEDHTKTGFFFSDITSVAYDQYDEDGPIYVEIHAAYVDDVDVNDDVDTAASAQARADAAAARLRDAERIRFEVEKILDTAPELIQQANAERDEAREKLDEIRAYVAELDAWHGRKVDLPFVERVRAIVERPAAAPAEPREEPARPETLHADYCARPDNHDGDCRRGTRPGCRARIQRGAAMSDQTPRVPELWWSPGRICVFSHHTDRGYFNVGQVPLHGYTYLPEPPADAVRLVPEAAEHQLAQDSEPADAVVRDRLRRARVEREQLSNALAELDQLQPRETEWGWRPDPVDEPLAIISASDEQAARERASKARGRDAVRREVGPWTVVES